MARATLVCVPEPPTGVPEQSLLLPEIKKKKSYFSVSPEPVPEIKRLKAEARARSFCLGILSKMENDEVQGAERGVTG